MKGEACRVKGEWAGVWFPLGPHVPDLVVSGMREGGGERGDLRKKAKKKKKDSLKKCGGKGEMRERGR